MLLLSSNARQRTSYRHTCPELRCRPCPRHRAQSEAGTASRSSATKRVLRIERRHLPRPVGPGGSARHHQPLEAGSRSAATSSPRGLDGIDAGEPSRSSRGLHRRGIDGALRAAEREGQNSRARATGRTQLARNHVRPLRARDERARARCDPQCRLARRFQPLPRQATYGHSKRREPRRNGALVSVGETGLEPATARAPSRRTTAPYPSHASRTSTPSAPEDVIEKPDASVGTTVVSLALWRASAHRSRMAHDVVSFRSCNRSGAPPHQCCATVLRHLAQA